MQAIYEAAVRLTTKGEAIVRLMQLRRLLLDLPEEDRAEVVEHVRELLPDLDQAA